MTAEYKESGIPEVFETSFTAAKNLYKQQLSQPILKVMNYSTDKVFF